MKTRKELTSELAKAKADILDHVGEIDRLERANRRREELADSHWNTVLQLREDLARVKEMATDNIREKALSFATGGGGLSHADEEVLRRAANYELYLRKGVSVTAYTGDRGDLQSLLAKLFESADEEQASLLSEVSKNVEDFTATYKAALKVNEEQKTRIQQLTTCGHDLVDALVTSAEYAQLPAQEGWSWYDALKKHAPAALEDLIRTEKTRHKLSDVTETKENADHEFATEAAEAVPTKEYIRAAVVATMAATVATPALREKAEEALEWVGNSLPRLDALATAGGYLSKAKVLYSILHEEV